MHFSLNQFATLVTFIYTDAAIYIEIISQAISVLCTLSVEQKLYVQVFLKELRSLKEKNKRCKTCIRYGI